MSTLANIRTKVRRLTGRPSSNQITDAEIDDYVNTFYLYDLPEELRLFELTSTFEFMTIPNVDQYDLRVMQVSDGAGGTTQASNIFYNLQPPLYIAGYQSFYSQSREQFFRVYPFLADILTTVVGDGTPGPYAFQLANVPVLQYSLSVGAVDNGNTTQQAIDVPTSRSTGSWQVPNNTGTYVGSINYVTGAGTITFSAAIPLGNQITITATPYQPNRPSAALYYDDVLTLRPVPDAPYKVTLDAFKLPTALLNANDSPELAQWWQFLAFGASKKIFQDTGNPEGEAAIEAAFREQERMVLRRSIVQQTNERTATIYTEMTAFPYANNWNRF